MSIIFSISGNKKCVENAILAVERDQGQFGHGVAGGERFLFVFYNLDFMLIFHRFFKTVALINLKV